MLTGKLRCLHAWLFQGCRWDEGWLGFGNRNHRAEFNRLARLGPPLWLESRETRSRVDERRVLLRYEFRFSQRNGRSREELVCLGDQTAMCVKDRELD